jgi:hypothetical protein
VGGGEGISMSFPMNCGIVKAKNMGVARVVLVQDVHSFVNLGQDVLICVIPIMSLPSLEQNSSTFLSDIGISLTTIKNDFYAPIWTSQPPKFH